MKQFIILKTFIFSSKTYAKDRLVSVNDVGEPAILRLEKRGFIKPVSEAAASYEEPAAFEKLDEFMLPEQVNRMKKQELLEYAKHIGVPEIDPSQNMVDLRGLVNAYIAGQKSKADGEDGEADA